MIFDDPLYRFDCKTLYTVRPFHMDTILIMLYKSAQIKTR